MSTASGALKITTGQTNIAVAGTAEQMPNVAIPDGYVLVIKAKAANTGVIQIGGSAAEAQGATPFELAAGANITLNVVNANVVWLDVTVGGEGVEYLAEQRG